MSAGEWVGTAGVSILLLAFALNVSKRLDSTSPGYLLLNTIGALLAGISAVIIRFWPFVLLEGVWALFSAFLFIRSVRNK